jgi:hypothetical protein
VPVEALLPEQAARVGVLAEVHVLLTPYFHLAEARALAPAGAQVVPLTFVASQEAVGALVGDLEAAAGLVEAADLVLATNAARLPGPLAARARRLLRVGWALEPGQPRRLAERPHRTGQHLRQHPHAEVASGAACGARPCRAATAR